LSYGRRKERLICGWNALASTSSRRNKHRTLNFQHPTWNADGFLKFEVERSMLDVGRFFCFFFQ